MSSDASVEHIIEYVIKHNTGIIEGLVAAIMLSALYLSYRGLTAKPEAAGAGGNLGDLEETLKKLLEKASFVAGPGGGAGGASPNPELLSQIEQLKKSLEDRQAEMENLRAQAANAGTSVNLSNEEKSKLEAQIKELSNKLAEYEIISEDIADLSFYKEENAKLQKQLEAAKASGSVPAAAPSPAAAPAVSAAPAVEPDIVGKSKAPREPVEEAPPAPAPEPAPAPAAAPSTPPPPVESAVTNSVIDDDLMAEFAKAVEEQKSGGASEGTQEEPLGAGVDMDKMLAEANTIGEGPVADVPGNALEATLDENKLMQEASDLQDIKPEDKTLMNDFENFVKKGN